MDTGPLVIGLDCSTTSTKAIAFDIDGNIVARAQESIPLHSPQPHYFEQDPEDWWVSSLTSLRSITRTIDPSRVKAIAISNQRETFVPLDYNGQCLRPAIVWLDERCKDEVESFARRIGVKTIHRITGKPPDYAPVVYRLSWMKRHEPNLYKSIGTICDVHAYIVWKLTGSFKTSWASADPFGLFDLRKKKWSHLILEALKLKERQLPSAHKPGTILGLVSNEASELTGLSIATLVVAGGGDGQAAGLGANAVIPARAYLNLGTAAVAGVYGTAYRTSRAFRTMSSCTEDGYYYECSLRAGTFAIDWFVKNILKINPSEQPGIYEELEHEAEQILAGSDGLLFLPYLCGVMNPYWDADARGAFVGISSIHTRGHMYRAILEGIAFEQLLAIEAVEKSTGSRVREFVAIGGGSTSKLWCQILADVTGREICIPENAEASALGAAINAAVGAGWFPSCKRAAIKMSRTGRIVKPETERQKYYRKLFDDYRSIYPRLNSGARSFST